MSRCDSAIQYATEEQDCTPGRSLPEAPVLCCERPSGHKGVHESGVHTWTRVDMLEPAS